MSLPCGRKCDPDDILLTSAVLHSAQGGTPEGLQYRGVPMRDMFCKCALFLAAGLLTVCTPSFAAPGHGDNGDDQAGMMPDHGNGNGNGEPGSHGNSGRQ